MRHMSRLPRKVTPQNRLVGLDMESVSYKRIMPEEGYSPVSDN
jgi:hypothetical protein